MTKVASLICIPLVMFLHFEASFLSHSTLGLVYVLSSMKTKE